MSTFYQNKKVIVTGGAGFLGSNLTHALVAGGAKVTVIDNFHPMYGGNEFNLKSIKDKIELVREDICNEGVIDRHCENADIIFHSAGQISHVDSMIDPFFDLQYNCTGTLRVLEAVKKSKKKTPVIYAGTRAILGAPKQIPANEQTLPNPTDVYGVNKHAAELYGAVYARVNTIPFVSIRLTNSFGRYHQMKNGKYGILNWFISLALQGQTIKIFGTGEQLRDYLYIDDAVSAFMKAGEFAEDLRVAPNKFPKVTNAGEAIPYAVFNLASGKEKKFADCAKMVTEIIGSKIEFVPWPADRKAIETGDYVADISAIKKYLNWEPKVSFESGLNKTIDFYKENLKQYI